MRYIYKVDGDGNCMFSSIAVCILHHNKFPKKPQQYKKYGKFLRKVACNQLERQIINNHTDIIEILCAEQLAKISSQNALRYVNHMKKNGSWGGCIELFALSNHVHSIGFKGIKVYNSSYKEIKAMCSKICHGGKSYIKLIFTNDSHFDAIISNT